jgi:hypothetical protein
MTLDDDLDLATTALLAEYAAGGYEPDGVGLATRAAPADDPATLGWGTTLHCITDCDEAFSEVPANSVAAVGESLMRRLQTPAGQILTDPEMVIAVGEDPDYGFDLSKMLHVGISDVEIQAYQDLASAECRKDDRVASATVTITRVGADEFNVQLYATLVTGARYTGVLPLTTDTAQTVGAL